MRRKSLLFKWACLLLLLIIIIRNGHLLPTVTVITSTDVLVIKKEISARSVDRQDGNILENDQDINLNNGQDWRKPVDGNLKSQMNYVPSNNKNESNLQGMSGAHEKSESQRVRTPKNSVLEKRHQVSNDKGNREVDMVKGDQIKEPRIKDDVKELKAMPKVSGPEGNMPKAFNEEYIRYFWKHPELYKDFLEFRKTQKIEEVDDKVTDSRKPETNAEADPRKTKSKQPIYITVDTSRGKLGNQMFQIASLIGIATLKNFSPIIPFQEFNINKVFKEQFQLSPIGELKDFTKFTDENKTFDATIKGIRQMDSHKNWTLDGYFQSFKYFEHIEDDVRQRFEIKDIYLTSARKFFQENVHAYHVKIAIHIRRQDFISSYQVKLGRVEVPADYVKNAQKYFQTKYQNVTFIVVSDDLSWCRQHIQEKNVVFSTGKSVGTDLALMAECDHVIMSVGTFGWWGGWLSGGTVIYYKHYPRPGSYLDSTFESKHYYPRNWIGME